MYSVYSMYKIKTRPREIPERETRGRNMKIESYRQSTLVLDMQPHLFDFNSPKFGAFFALFGPFGAIFGVGFKFKNFFGSFSIT